VKAQIVAPVSAREIGAFDRVKPFGYRSNRQVRRMKLTGAAVVVGLSVLLNIIVGLI